MRSYDWLCFAFSCVIPTLDSGPFPAFPPPLRVDLGQRKHHGSLSTKKLHNKFLIIPRFHWGPLHKYLVGSPNLHFVKIHQQLTFVWRSLWAPRNPTESNNPLKQKVIRYQKRLADSRKKSKDNEITFGKDMTQMRLTVVKAVTPVTAVRATRTEKTRAPDSISASAKLARS